MNELHQYDSITCPRFLVVFIEMDGLLVIGQRLLGPPQVSVRNAPIVVITERKGS
jgi:hypothetical protein